MRISVYNQITHIHALTLDLRRAKLSVKVMSPYLAKRNIQRWEPELKALVDRGVVVDVIVNLPDHYYGTHPLPHKEAENQELRECVAMLEAIGVHVNLVPNIHTKVVIIDYRLLWDGSLNFLSSNPKSNISERVNRYDDVIHAMAAYAHHNLERCSICETRARKEFEGLFVLSVEFPNSEANYPAPEWRSQGKLSYSLESSDLIELSKGERPAPRFLSHWLKQKRTELGFNPSEIAAAIKVARSALSSIEAGRSIPTVATLARFANTVGWEMVMIPHPLVPLVDYIVRSYHRAGVSKLVPKPVVLKKRMGRAGKKTTTATVPNVGDNLSGGQDGSNNKFNSPESACEASQKDSTDEFNLPPHGPSGLPTGSL